MAGSSGTAGLSDTRGNKNVVAQIAQLSWEKVKSAEKMAGSERAYARKKLKVGEEGGLSKEEFREKFGRGSFFRKALGSEFGGDKVARNRGRVESFFDKDVPGGRDATKSKRSRYRSQFDYGGADPQDPMVGSKPKTERTKEEGERRSASSSRMAVNEAMASALAGIEIQLTKLSEKFTTTVSVPEGLIEVVNKQSKVITEGFDGLNKALYSLLGSIQKQTATMVRLDQEQKILDQKSIDRQQALDEENLLEGQNGGAGNAAVTGFSKSGKGKGGGGGGILGKMFGATALARKIGRRGAGRAGLRAAAALGGRGAARTMAKHIGKSAAKGGLKAGLKKIPLLGLGVGALFAAQRAMKGDIIGAGLELASGAASIVPGAGTAASLGVDGVLAARDAGVIPFVKGGFIPGGKPVFGMIGEKVGVNEMVLPWTEKTFAMMNKARLDAIQKNKSKFADVQAKGLQEYYENRGGWEKFGEILIGLLRGAGINPDDTPPPGNTVSSAPGEAKLAAFVATMESSALQDQADVMQSMVNRAGQNYSGHGGLFGQLTAKNQYSPLSAAIWGTSDPDAQARYGPVADKLGATPQKRIEKLKEIISQPDGLAQLEALFGGISNASAAKTLVDDFYSGGPLSTEAARFIQGRTDFGAASGVGGAQGSGQIKRNSNTFGAANASKGASSLTAVAPPPEPPAPPDPSKPPVPKQSWALGVNNYGLPEGTKIPFTHKGVEYFAERAKAGGKEGWAVFKKGFPTDQLINTQGTANDDLKAPMIKAIQDKTNQALAPSPKASETATRTAVQSEQVAMARTKQPVEVIGVGSNTGSSSVVPKGDSADPGLSGKNLRPAFADYSGTIG